MPCASKDELCPELDYSRGDALDSTADHAECRRTAVQVHRGRVRIVVLQEVEELRAEFERLRFLKPKRLVDREVHVCDARQAHRTGAGRGSEAAERNLREGRGIEPGLP